MDVVQIRRGIIPKTLRPISAEVTFSRDGFQPATSAMDYRIVGVHTQKRFDIASAVGIEPIHCGGHRVKGHILTYMPFIDPV
jgi:hypothetical protein